MEQHQHQHQQGAFSLASLADNVLQDIATGLDGHSLLALLRTCRDLHGSQALRACLFQAMMQQLAALKAALNTVLQALPRAEDQLQLAGAIQRALEEVAIFPTVAALQVCQVLELRLRVEVDRESRKRIALECLGHSESALQALRGVWMAGQHAQQLAQHVGPYVAEARRMAAGALQLVPAGQLNMPAEQQQQQHMQAWQQPAWQQLQAAEQLLHATQQQVLEEEERQLQVTQQRLQRAQQLLRAEQQLLQARQHHRQAEQHADQQTRPQLLQAEQAYAEAQATLKEGKAAAEQAVGLVKQGEQQEELAQLKLRLAQLELRAEQLRPQAAQLPALQQQLQAAEQHLQAVQQQLKATKQAALQPLQAQLVAHDRVVVVMDELHKAQQAHREAQEVLLLSQSLYLAAQLSMHTVLQLVAEAGAMAEEGDLEEQALLQADPAGQAPAAPGELPAEQAQQPPIQVGPAEQVPEVGQQAMQAGPAGQPVAPGQQPAVQAEQPAVHVGPVEQPALQARQRVLQAPVQAVLEGQPQAGCMLQAAVQAHAHQLERLAQQTLQQLVEAGQARLLEAGPPVDEDMQQLRAAVDAGQVALQGLHAAGQEGAD